MTYCSTPAIMIRRVHFGDADLILTFFTKDHGKISLIAKHAKKSFRRFCGVLELFSGVNIVWKNTKNKLPVLQEASLNHPYDNIRGNLSKTAYASYWAEILLEWVQEDVVQPDLYHLFNHVLTELNSGILSEEFLSILFQIHFLKVSGLKPNMTYCSICKTDLDAIRKQHIVFNMTRGGIVCPECVNSENRQILLSKATVKYLLWLSDCAVDQAARLRFSDRSRKECLQVLEHFIVHQLGILPKSLTFLREIRN